MSAAAPAVPLSPLALLRQLDRWLGASQHDAAHPWRQSIAATLAMHGEGGAAGSADDLSNVMGRLGNALWSLQAVMLAASAYAKELSEDGPIDDDGVDMLLRVMRVASAEAERLAMKVAEGPASWGEA